MLLYLARYEHFDYLDFLQAEENLIIKKLGGPFCFNELVIKGVRNWYTYEYIVLDWSAKKDDVPELLQAIESLQLVSLARFILFCPGEEPTEPIFRQLYDLGCYNMVFGKDVPQLQEELRQCVSDNGMDQAALFRKLQGTNDETDRRITREAMMVCFVGAAPASGTTTSAIAMANYFSFAGRATAYVDAVPDSQLLTLLAAEDKELRAQEVGWKRRNTLYVPSGSSLSGIPFLSLDCGVYHQDKASLLELADLVVLCCRSKPWELPTVKRVLQELTVPVTLLFSFSQERDQEKLRAIAKSKHQVLFSEYVPNLYDFRGNMRIWEQLVMA